MAKKSDSLSALLAQSFAPAPSVSPVPELVVEQQPAKAEPTPAVSLVSQDYESLKKTTVTFQAEDQRLIDEILDSLKRVTRHRGGYSDAVKIALRLCKINDGAIAKAYEEIKAADRRTRENRI